MCSLLFKTNTRLVKTSYLGHKVSFTRQNYSSDNLSFIHLNLIHNIKTKQD